MELVLTIRFITGIIFVFIGIYLLYLVKQDRAKLIVQGEVRLTFGSYQAYLGILYGISLMVIATIPWLIPELPSWAIIAMTIIFLVLISITLRNRNIKRN